MYIPSIDFIKDYIVCHGTIGQPFPLVFLIQQKVITNLTIIYNLSFFLSLKR